MNVLVLNSGSSSLKFQIIATDAKQVGQGKEERVCRGEIEGIGGEATLRIQHRDETERRLTATLGDIAAALEYLVRYIVSEQSEVKDIRSAADVLRD